jgi:hypothetical protein
MRVLTRLATALWLLAAAESGCTAVIRPQPGAACPDRARAFAAALGALARARGVESPRAIAGAIASDPVCPAGDLDARVRCHLTRPTASVSARRAGAAWLFTFALPELSDHVHRARVWRQADGRIAAEVESEN